MCKKIAKIAYKRGGGTGVLVGPLWNFSPTRGGIVGDGALDVPL